MSDPVAGCSSDPTTLITCREIEGVLPLFFDGELDVQQTRAVALHIGRCRTCEGELDKLGKLQEAISSAVRERTSQTLTGSIWEDVKKRLPPPRRTLAERIGDWWDGLSPRALYPVPVVAAAVVGFLVAVALLRHPERRGVETAAASAAAAASAPHESPVRVEEIESSSAIALLRDADILALWIDEENPAGMSTPVSAAVSDLASEDLVAEPVAEGVE